MSLVVRVYRSTQFRITPQNGESKAENRRSDFGRVDRRVDASLNIVQINKTRDTRRSLPPLEGRLDS
jgi:hypothetical protein